MGQVFLGLCYRMIAFLLQTSSTRLAQLVLDDTPVTVIQGTMKKEVQSRGTEDKERHALAVAIGVFWFHRAVRQDTGPLYVMRLNILIPPIVVHSCDSAVAVAVA